MTVNSVEVESERIRSEGQATPARKEPEEGLAISDLLTASQRLPVFGGTSSRPCSPSAAPEVDLVLRSHDPPHLTTFGFHPLLGVRPDPSFLSSSSSIKSLYRRLAYLTSQIRVDKLGQGFAS
ncbi:unnamed protein product [Nezara viridula]|uniref:Uncharacterized protein n=1 Tax=Nezara viridula TaxID=85310 RepID=A0A9P0MWU4_NEZVI|nr:unnamed protein product [Nezara viridula]